MVSRRRSGLLELAFPPSFTKEDGWFAFHWVAGSNQLAVTLPSPVRLTAKIFASALEAEAAIWGMVPLNCVCDVIVVVEAVEGQHPILGEEFERAGRTSIPSPVIAMIKHHRVDVNIIHKEYG
jgi:hypothetical protein